MRYTITGATGLIGRELTKEVLNLGYKIDAISKHGGMINGFTVSPLDLIDPVSVSEYFKNKETDIVIHLACKIPASFNDGEAADCFIPNIQATMNMLETAVSLKASKFIYTSSISLYTMGASVFSEEDRIHPYNYYSTSKYVGEILCEQFCNSRGLQNMALRISSPYSTYYRHLTIIHRFVQAAVENKNIELWGSGKRSQDFVFIDDVVDAILLATKKDANGVINIASGETISMLQLAKKVLKAAEPTKSRIAFLNKPDPQEDFVPHVNINLAKEKLGYEPKNSIDRGLKKLVSYYRNNKD